MINIKIKKGLKMKVYNKKGVFITRAERLKIKEQKDINIFNIIMFVCLNAYLIIWFITITN